MIEVKNLTKKYDDLVMDQVSFTIPDTGLTFIHGKSGCGKSTLLNLMSGMDLNYTGEIKIDGKVLNKKNASELRSSYISYMNQQDELIQEMTVKENLVLIQRMAHSRFDTHLFLKKFDLLGIEDEYPHELSGGELSLVCLLKNILLNRPYLFLDEPNAKLDEKRKKLLKETLLDMSKNISVVIVSHDLEYMDHADCLLNFEYKKVVVEKNDKSEKKKVKKSKFNFDFQSQLKLLCNNFKFNWMKYLFSTIVLTVLILSSFSFLNIGNDLYPQIAGIVDNSENLECIHISKKDFTYSLLEEIRKEDFVEKLDYTLLLLYPPENKGDTIIQCNGHSYSFADLPVTYTYHREDELKENEIMLSNNLLGKLDVEIGDEIELTLNVRVSQTPKDVGQLYTPILESYTYSARIAGTQDSLVDKEVPGIFELSNHITVSNEIVEMLIRDYVEKDNMENLIAPNGAKLFVKPGITLAELQTKLSKFDVICRDLHLEIRNHLMYNESTYSILKVYGVVCIISAVIFIMTSLSSYHQYESKQKESLKLLGISNGKILRLQLIQNLIPFMLATIISLITLKVMTPILNQYFYNQKLFYSPFLSLSQFIKEDYSTVQILLFNFAEFMKIVGPFETLIFVYKVVLFRKKKS